MENGCQGEVVPIFMILDLNIGALNMENSVLEEL